MLSEEMRAVEARVLVGREYLLAPRSPDLQGRHSPFWERRPMRHPLVGLFRQGMLPMARFVERIGDGEIYPEQIPPANWLDLYEETFQRTGLYWGDLVWWASPLNGFPWVEAIAGCPVVASRAAGSVWVNPHSDLRRGLTNEAVEQVLVDLTFNPGNPWLQKLLECTRALVEHAAGRFPVSPGIMRGASDLVAAMLGPEAFCLALYDHPQAVTALAEASVRLWLQVIAAQMEFIPPFAGGYVNAGLWAPGPCPVYQEDASALISENAFRRFFLTAGRRVWEEYPYGILHLHSGGLQILPALLEDPCPPVIEINIDPAGPSLDRLLPTFAEIQRHTRLEVLGTQEQIERCIRELPAAGTAYLVLEESLGQF